MTKTADKPQTVTKQSTPVRIWSATQGRLMAQAMQAGMSFVEYLEDLSIRASGVETHESIELPKKGTQKHEAATGPIERIFTDRGVMIAKPS